MKIELALCLPRDAETVAVVRDVAIGALSELGVREHCVDDIRLALSEACTNVIDHSGTEDEYEVRLVVEDTKCEMRVIDAGGGLDFTTLQGTMPDPMSARGRGMAIMRAVVDTVNFISEPESGTMVHLVKQLELTPEGPLARLLRRSGD
jgi:serine/threonine-protein kinase RsbW